MALVDHVSLFESIQYEIGGSGQSESLSARRPVKSLSPQRRKQKIKEEQLWAAQQRVAKEASRKKLLMDDTALFKLRTPHSYIAEARARYNRRTRSSLPSGRTSPFRSHASTSLSHSSPDSPPPPKPITALPKVDQKTEVKIPAWVLQREDFASSYKRIKAERFTDVEAICKKDGSNRTPSERIGLKKWAEMVPILANMTMEALDRLQTVYLTPKDTIEQVQALFIVLQGCLQYQSSDIPLTDVPAGHYFGSEAVTGRPFPDLVITPMQETVALRLKKTDFEQISMVLFVKEKRESTEFLSKCVYFSTLSNLKIQRLSRAVERVEYTPDTLIYSHGEVSNALYIVKRGEVVLQLPVTVGQNYRWPVGRHSWEVSKLDMVYNLTIKSCGEGQFFGENELEPLERRKTSARTVGKAICYVVSRDKFLEVFTPREISDLRLYGNLTISSQKECEERVLQQFKAHKDYKQALVSAANIDYNCPGTRDSILDRHTKKLMKWIVNLKTRSQAKERAVRRGIVHMKRDRIVVQSIEMLGGQPETL